MLIEHKGHKGTQRKADYSGPDHSQAIIGCGMRVHTTVGPGLLESVYEECLCHELTLAGLKFRRQVDIPIHYQGFQLAPGLRLDLLVEESAIVEVKAIERILPIHEAQLLTYLRLAGIGVGLLLNFNVSHFRDGIRRRVI